MTVMIGTCSTCLHFRAVGQDPTLCCTKRPPQGIMMVEPDPRDPTRPVMRKYTFFPSPEAGWSCGEHRSKTNH